MFDKFVFCGRLQPSWKQQLASMTDCRSLSHRTRILLCHPSQFRNSVTVQNITGFFFKRVFYFVFVISLYVQKLYACLSNVLFMIVCSSTHCQMYRPKHILYFASLCAILVFVFAAFNVDFV